MNKNDYTEHYSEIHRETHRRVYPWLAGPLLARHLTLLPSQSIDDDPSGKTQQTALKAFEATLKSLDPFRKKLQFNSPPWSFERSNWESIGKALPTHVRLKKPYIARAVPYGFIDQKPSLIDPSAVDDDFQNYVRILQRGDVFGEYFTITQILEIPLNPNFALTMGLVKSTDEEKELKRYLGAKDVAYECPDKKNEADAPPEYAEMLYETVWKKN
ncbi:MAG: hypothetical protein AAGF60_02415 [Pseudomonadota bacterium]